MSQELFFKVVKQGILSLPLTLKTILRIAEDPEIPDEAQGLATGALIHWLSSANTIPGFRGVLSYVDDVLVFLLVLEQLETLAPSVVDQYRQDAPEFFMRLAEELEIIRNHLGGAVSVLENATAGLKNIKFKGYNALQCAFEEEAGNWLYEEVQSSLIELDLEEEEVSRVLNKGLVSIIEVIKQRAGKTS